MGGSSSSQNRILHLKVVFGAVLALTVGVIFLFSVGSQMKISGSTKNIAPTSLMSDSGGDFNHAHLMGGEKQLLDHPDLDLNCMSKRRVPNGPDPIHNRRAGHSGQPPGRSN